MLSTPSTAPGWTCDSSLTNHSITSLGLVPRWTMEFHPGRLQPLSFKARTLFWKRETFCSHGGSAASNWSTYLRKQVFPYCAFGCHLNLLGAFRKWTWPQTWILHSFFVFLCFDHFYPPQFAFFFFLILLWPVLSMSYSLEPQYPGAIQRIDFFFFLLQNDQNIGTMWNSVGEFLTCPLQKQQNEK